MPCILGPTQHSSTLQMCLAMAILCCQVPAARQAGRPFYFTASCHWLLLVLTRYALVSYDNGELVVEKEELMPRSLQLHEGLGHGDVVEVLDSWCDTSYPGSILASKAFTEVCVAVRSSSSLHR